MGRTENASQFVRLLVLSLAAVGSVSFLLIARASGFTIDVALFALPVVAFLAILVLSKTVISFGFVTERFRTPLFIIVFLFSAILRLVVVFYASYYPDEYNVWLVFKTNPLADVPSFLHNYAVIAWPESVHPPLGFLLMSVGYEALNSMEGARLVSVVAGLLSIPVAYWLMSMLLDRPTALAATMIFSLLPQTVVFLSIALTDAYVFLFGLLSLTTFVSAIKNRTSGFVVASGVFLGLAFWSKAAIPFLWAFAISLSALSLGWVKRRENIVRAFFCFLIGGTIYGFLYLVSPGSFLLSAEVLPRILSFSRINIGPVSMFPQIENAHLSTISYFDLLFQLPAWLTVLVLVFGIFGVYGSLRAWDRRTLWITPWAMVPLLAMVFYYRDVRYLLVSSVPIAILTFIGIRLAADRKAIFGIVLVFLAVSSVSFIPIVQQDYSGIREASEVLNSLGLSNQTIVSNVPPIKLFLTSVKVIYLSHSNNSKSAHALLESEHVAAAVVIHHRRGAWGGEPSPDVMQLIHEYFNQKIQGGLSGFSWYEVLYSAQLGAPSQLSASVGATVACEASLCSHMEHFVIMLRGNPGVGWIALSGNKLRTESSGVRN